MNSSYRGEICHCRHCQRQCKIFVNFSIFTYNFFGCLSPKLLKFGEIKGVKCLSRKSGGVIFLTNLMFEFILCPFFSQIKNKGIFVTFQVHQTALTNLKWRKTKHESLESTPSNIFYAKHIPGKILLKLNYKMETKHSFISDESGN